MPDYRLLSEVMASTATGTVVPSAYGDQMRDNLVALDTGWYFQATGVVSQVAGFPNWVQIGMTTIAETTPSVGTATVTSSVQKVVLTTLTGYWWVTGWVNASGNRTDPCQLAILSDSTISSLNTGAVADTIRSIRGATFDDQAVSAVVRVTTSPWYLSLWVRPSTSNLTLDSTLAPQLNGLWLGDL